MSLLEQRPTDRELRDRAEAGTSDGRRAVNGIVLGPDSPLLKSTKARQSVGKSQAIGVFAADAMKPRDALDPRGEMNGWERQRAQELEAARVTGHIRSWKFDDVILRLANNTRYRPDFMLVYAESHGIRVVFEEVKGHWRDDARVKIKDGGGWQVEVIRP